MRDLFELDPHSYAVRSLNETFALLMNDARSSLGSQAWPEGLALMALRYGSADTAHEGWRRLADLRSSDGAADQIRSIARDFETKNSSLEGVFTRALLTGLERIESSTLQSWSFRLAQLSRNTIEPSIFGRWMNDTLTSRSMDAPKNGNATTPPSVARLMVELADIQDNDSVFDPCCGIGTTLAAAVGWAHQHQRTIAVSGQELNVISWAFSALRMFYLNQYLSEIRLGDSLRQPAFLERDQVKRFDRVFCDAPLGLMLRDRIDDAFGRFASSPGRGPADNAFVQHALASLQPAGKGVLLVSHGFLFRSGADAQARKHLLDLDMLQAVISLPAKLLPTSAIPTALVILGKNRTGRVVLIDGARLQPGGRGKTELADSTIHKILELIRHPDETSDICRQLTRNELAESDFIVLPRRYTSPQEDATPDLDIPRLLDELRTLDSTARRTASEWDELALDLLPGTNSGKPQ